MTQENNVQRFLVDDTKGGKNIKYNNLLCGMFGDKPVEIGFCRANFSAGAVVIGYDKPAVWTEAEREKIGRIANSELKQALLNVSKIAEVVRSLVISFNCDKKFIITVHYTELGAKYMTAVSGKMHEVDTEYYEEGKFNIDEKFAESGEECDCGVVLNGCKLKCILSAETGLVTVKDFLFEEIPTVIVDETPNVSGGYDVKPDELVFKGEVMKDVRYGYRVMRKSQETDINYAADKAESEAQRTMRETLDLYIPENFDKSRANGIVLCIHGGAWTGGSKESYTDACKYYASLGYFAATINHSYVCRTYEDNGERVTFDSIMQEIDLAFAKIKQLSDENGWNISKAATTGYSSGSHLATLYAYSLGHRKDTPIPVVFTFSMVGSMSFHIDFWDKPTMAVAPQIASFYMNDPKLFVMPEEKDKAKSLEAAAAALASREREAEYNYTTYDRATFDEKIDAISPIAYVEKGMGLPTILAEASRDYVLISDTNATKMEEALTKAGLEHKTIIFPNSDHAGAGNAECGNVYRKYQRLYLKKYFG